MAKLKSGNAIVRLLLSHGEKLGILAILVCTGMLIWSAMGIERLGDDREPEDLQNITRQARQNIESSKWDEIDPNSESKISAGEASTEAMADLDPTHYPTFDHSWNRPVTKPIQLRKDPELLTVENLEVNGDSGLWASADPAVIERNRLAAMREAEEKQKELEKNQDRRGEDDRDFRGETGGLFENSRGGGRRGGLRGDDGRGSDSRKKRKRDGPIVVTSGSRSQLQGFEEIREQSWVTVVGKIPIEQQSKIYDEALQDALGYDPSHDLPNYLGYTVERADVTPDGTGEWKKIAVVTETRLIKRIESYPQLGTVSLVPSHHQHPLLTHPLPPLVLRDWDRRVTHSEIPTVEEEIEAEQDELKNMEEEVDDTVAEGDDPFAMRSRTESGEGRFDRRMGGRGGRSRGMGRMGGGRSMGGPMGGRGADMFGEGMFGGEGMYGEGMYGGEGEMSMGGRGGGRMMGGGRSMMGGIGEFVWDYETSHILFRYFDNEVEPGGRYRYRVRLAIADVNHEVPEQYLDKTVTERVKQEKKRYRLTEWSEPSPIASVPLPARVYLASVEAPKSGGVPKAKILVKVFDEELPAALAHEMDDSLRGTVLNPQEKATVIWTQSNRSQSDEDTEKFEKEFLFKTGITLLDMRGGESLSKKNSDLMRPAQVLLMDASGRLFVQSELEDSEATKEFELAKEGGDGRGGYGGSRGYGGGLDYGEGMESF